MSESIAAGVVGLGLGVSQAYLVELDAGLVLVDTGVPGRAERILAGVAAAGRSPRDLGSIVLTHQHRDHAGSAAALVRATEARLLVHAADAATVRGGLVPATGTVVGRLGRALGRFAPALPIEAAAVEHELADGDRVGGPTGLRVVHTPGHTPGHISLLLERDGGILFAGDAAANLFGRLGRPFVATDWAAVATSVGRLATLEFETAVFGHGRVIRGAAAGRFRRLAERLAARPTGTTG